MAVRLKDLTTDQVSYGDVAAVGDATVITVAITFKPTNLAGASGSRLISQWSSTNSERAFILQVNSTDELRFDVRDDAGPDQFGHVTDALNMVDGREYRIVVTWIASTPNVIKFWVNGVLEASSDTGGSDCGKIENSPLPVVLGYHPNPDNNPNPGDYSEFAMWDHIIPGWMVKGYGHGWSPDFYKRGRILYDPLLNAQSGRRLLGSNQVAVHTGTTPATHPRMRRPDDRRPIIEPAKALLTGSIVPTVAEVDVVAGVT